jgi:predicted Ser/Thr protein kinase
MHPTAFGKYQVVALIGEGGFGRVFKGLDPDLKRPVAIKTCSLTEPEMRERFFREAEIAAKLHHPNITTIYDFGRVEGEPYLVQEYLTGQDLDHIIKDPSRISLETKIDYLIQVGEGLGHAHANGVIHRDVKPANIRILDDGQVRIMDFGIARLVEETQRFTQVGMTIGTAGYLSPEQLQGLDVDHRSDIFSFGVLAYELILSKSPFEGESISALFYAIAHHEPAPIQEVWPGCPPALAACVSRCLEKDRDVRYGSFKEVTADLRNALEGLEGMGAVAGAAVSPSVAGAATAASTSGSATSAFTGARTVGASTPRGGRDAGVVGPGGGPGTPATSGAGAGSTGRKKWLLPMWGIVGVALIVALFEVVRFTGSGEASPGGSGEGDVLPVDTSSGMADAGERADSGTVRVGGEGEAAQPGGGTPVREQPQGAGQGAAPGAVTTGTPVREEPTAAAAEPEAPFRGSATLVLFWSGGGDPGSVTTAENAFLEELARRRLQGVEAGILAGIHEDAAAVAMARGMDARAIAVLGREYDAEVVVVGTLRTEAEPSAGRFYTGRAVLDVRTYRTSTAELLGSETFQVGANNTPGELGPSPLAAETEAAKEVGRRAAVGVALEFADALPRRR